MRQGIQHGFLGTVIVKGDSDQEVVQRGLGILRRDIEIAVVGEGVRVGDLKFAIVQSAAGIAFFEFRIGEGALRILV